MDGKKTVDEYTAMLADYGGCKIWRSRVPRVQQVQSLNVYPDDIFVSSFPKSGTTWLQEIVYLVCNQADTKKARSLTLEERFPYLEYDDLGMSRVQSAVGKRMIKTHLSANLLPKKLHEAGAKVLYTARNPKDTVVSYYHFVQMISEYNYGGTQREFVQAFCGGNVEYGPWCDHVLGYWKLKDHPNVLFLTYEEMHQNIRAVILKIASFLKQAITEEQVNIIEQHTSFNVMKNNKSTNYSWLHATGEVPEDTSITFMRKGAVGGWKKHLTAEENEMIEDLIRTKLKPAGLKLIDQL